MPKGNLPPAKNDTGCQAGYPVVSAADAKRRVVTPKKTTYIQSGVSLKA
jgi:hypothetical protein